jgi:hypothetical protein
LISTLQTQVEGNEQNENVEEEESTEMETTSLKDINNFNKWAKNQAKKDLSNKFLFAGGGSGKLPLSNFNCYYLRVQTGAASRREDSIPDFNFLFDFRYTLHPIHGLTLFTQLNIV